MIKFFIDECIHGDVVIALRKSGFDVLTVREANLAKANDDCVFNFACQSKRILLTFDRGFGDIFRFNISRCFGIIIILVGQFNKDEIIIAIINFLNAMENSGGLKNRLAIIGKNKIRIIS
ncbi:MAG: DUF5615 family PIN-like protein [bacterium]|nr:DUF5615 family PIN-like protein [bacterium]